MKLLNLSLSFLAFIVVFGSVNAQNRLVCFWNPMSSNRNGRGISTIKQIEPHLCTHLVYGYFNVDIDGTIRQPQIGNVDEVFIYNFVSLRRINPDVKIFASIGGPDHNPYSFETIASDSDKRIDFANKILQFLTDFNFDGVDLYWPFPKTGIQQDFVALLEEIKNILSENGKSLTISATTDDRSLTDVYNILDILKFVDFVNVDIARLNDINGISNVTAHHAPISSLDQFNFNSILTNWELLNLPIENLHKIVPGIPTYGRSYTLEDSNLFTVGAPATGNGRRGEFGAENIRDTSILPFHEICYSLQNYQDNWRSYYDGESRVPYAVYNTNQWVSYEDRKSVEEKVFAALKERNFGGVAFYDIDMDDYANDCGYGTYPLLRAAYDLIVDELDPPTPSEPDITTTTTSDTTTTYTQIPDPEFSCWGRPDGNYQNPANCRTFFICANGRKFLFDCPNRLYYNPEPDQCLHRPPPEGCVVPVN